MKTMIRLTVILLTVLLALALFACDSDKKEDVTTEAATTEKVTTGEVTTADPLLSKELNILFIGNSFTYQNSMPETIFAPLIEASPYQAKTVKSITKSKYTLKKFSTKTDEMGKLVEEAFASDTVWDIVIFQEQSTMAIDGVNNFLNPLKTLIARARQNNPDVRCVIYETWAFDDEHADTSKYGGYDKMAYDLCGATDAVADKVGLPVSNVGMAFMYLHKNTSIEVYHTDHKHPSVAGSYAAAAGLYYTIFPNAEKDFGYKPASISDEDAATLRDAAWNASKDTISCWTDVEKEQYKVTLK